MQTQLELAARHQPCAPEVSGVLTVGVAIRRILLWCSAYLPRPLAVHRPAAILALCMISPTPRSNAILGGVSALFILSDRSMWHIHVTTGGGA